MKKFIYIGLILFVFVELGLKYQELEQKRNNIQKAMNDISRSL